MKRKYLLVADMGSSRTKRGNLHPVDLFNIILSLGTSKNIFERLEMTGHSPARSSMIFLISFDVIALFTFPYSVTQGWLVSVKRKKGGSKVK